jgi:erythronate-4-phosphate dehydrogenase
MNILADASLPGLIEAFPAPFKLTLYRNNKELSNLLEHQDMLLCRAHLKVNHRLLKNHQLQHVATASSGSDNLDHEYLQSHNITAMDAKGCNAVSVADYVISCLSYLDKMHLMQGNKLGIIGLGHVGLTVFKRVQAAGFELFCFDPPKDEQDEHFDSCTQEELYDCDILCIHSELHTRPPHASANLVNEYFLSLLKPGCIIINAARGGIVDENALLNKADSLIYCTDVYLNEPRVNKKIIELSTLCTPHIAGHSLEAKYSAVSIISKKIHQHLGLPLPVYARPISPPKITVTDQQSWQEIALTIYNPVDDTQRLKQAKDLETAFVQMRKQHINRHDFYTYLAGGLDNTIKRVLSS